MAIPDVGAFHAVAGDSATLFPWEDYLLMSRIAFPLTLFAATLMAGMAPAELLVYEPFDYADGSGLAGQNGGGGFTSAWRDASIAGGTIVAGSLSGPAGLPTSGGHAILAATDRDTLTIFRDFVEVAGNDGDTTWVSWLGQRQGDAIPVPDTQYGDNAYPRGVNAGLFNADHPDRAERIAIGNSSNAAANEWSIIPEGRGTDRAGTGVPYETLVWAVMRIDHHGDITTADDAYLWIDPDPTVEPSIGSADASAIGVFDYSGLDHIRPFIGNNSSNRPAGQLAIDEIRIGTSYAAMSATSVVPEPAALCLAGLAACGLVGRRRR